VFGGKQVEHKLARALETVGKGALDEIIEAVPGGMSRTTAYKGLLALVGQGLAHVAIGPKTSNTPLPWHRAGEV
jgi:hypothetical protein